MGNTKSIKKNYIYSLFFQTLTLVIPLITTPYVSRVLGAEGIGAISYTQNNISYLILIGNFGLGLYATRQIAYCVDDPQKLKECFSNLLFTRLVSFTPVLLIYTGIVIYSSEFRMFYLVEFVHIADALVDVSWFFNGSEEFHVTVRRGTLVKIASVILIFCLVKKPTDIYLYVFILGAGQLIGNAVVFWVAYKRQGGILRPRWMTIWNNMKGGVILFIPQLASSLYFYCDKIMIKWLSLGTVENGYYEQAQKLIRLSTTIITALPTVMMPRIAAEFSKKNSNDIAEYMKKSLEFVLVLGFPLMFGLIGISDVFVPWFFGDAFDKVKILLKIMAPIILFNSIYNVIGYQYFIAVKKEKVFTCTILCGAAVNILLNFFTIPVYGAIGASLASVLAEITIVIVQAFVLFKNMKLKGLMKPGVKSLLGAFFMLLFIMLTRDWYGNDIVATFVSIVLGVLIYTGLMFLMRNDAFIYYLTVMTGRRKRNAGKK